MPPKHTFRILRGVLALAISGWLGLSIPGSVESSSLNSSPNPHYLQAGPPLADLDLGKYSGFTLGDVDGDGDTDALVGSMTGSLEYYRNAGGPNLGASFYRELDSRYPYGIKPDQLDYAPEGASTYAHPELVDNNKDGYVDLFIGALDRRTVPPSLVVDYYQNDGGVFNKKSGGTPDVPSITGIPICRIIDSSHPEYDSQNWLKEIMTLAVGDLTADGVQDAVVGVIYQTSQGSQYQLLIYRGVFDLYNKKCPVLISNYASQPVDLRLPGARPFPELHDIDGDGDLDLFVGLSSGVVRFFENTGTPTQPDFILRKGAKNPLNPPDTTDSTTEPDFGAYVVPEFGDLSLDRYADFAALSGDGRVFAMRYDPDKDVNHLVPWLTPADFLMPLDSGGRIVGIDQGAGSATLADLDGDGDVDVLTGGKDGKIRNYKNLMIETGRREFIELSGASRWFPAEANAFPFGVPLLANFDGQASEPGDADLIISAKLSSCPDISTSMAATLAEAPPSQPADVDTPQPPVSPADASSLWRMCYYENEGTITTPDFRLNASDNTNGQRYDPFIDPDGFLLELIGEYLVPSVVVADNSYQSFPDLVIGSKADGFQYLRNIGDESGPYFELGDPVEIGLGDLSISYAAPVFLDVDDDGISDLVVGSGDGTIRYFHNDQAPDNPFIGPFSEITGIDNPYSFLNAGQYAAPIYADVDSDGDQDLVLGSVLNTFAFYENITRPGAGVDQMAFVDYRFNPLGSVVPPGYADPYYRSVNFADLDQDGDLDAFVGSYSGAEYYLNLGTPQQAAFRLQPPERNPLRDVPPSNAATNVTFADTHPLQPGLEAYVGIRISGKGFLKGYQYNQVSQKYVLMSTQPFESFPPSNYSSNYEVSTRVAFIYNQDKGCMDAYVMMGYFKDRWYAVNQFLCDGLDGVGNPIYYPPMDATQFEENIGSAANPFYKLNWPLQSYFTDGQWNGSLVSQAAPDVWWFGNNLGEVQTLERSFYDKQNLATYIDRVTDIRDPFKGVKLVSPTIPTATDTNGDGLVDAYIASASGTIQYFTGSPVPPPSAEAGNPKVFLPLIQK